MLLYINAKQFWHIFVLSKLEGQERVYLTHDSAITENQDEAQNFPPEFLYHLTPSGMPPHRLVLRNGAIIMLLRNLDIKRGLCNGTRLIIRNLYDHMQKCWLVAARESEFPFLK